MTQKPKITGFKYDPSTFEKELKNGFEKLNYRNYIKSDTKVFLKPNLTLPFYKRGVTTNPEIIESVLGILKDRADEVYIGESDGGSNSFTADYSLRNHGIPEICRRTGATIANLSEDETVCVEERINNKDIKVNLPKLFFRIDESISIPVIKVHVITGVSLSLKNLWGCHPNTLRLLDHPKLSEILVLIARLINLRLVLIDGIYGLNRRGPIDGDILNMDAIFMGDNPVSTDAFITRLMGFDPKDIKHIMLANSAGLGPYKTDEIDVIGNLPKFHQDFYLKPSVVDLLTATTFKYDIVNKTVFDSCLTKPVYKITGRKYHKKILKTGDEI